MRAAPTAALLAFVALALGGRFALADEAGAASPGRAHAAKVRASIPAPVEPEEGKPGMGFEYEGDLLVAGDVAGSVKTVVDVGTYRDQPVWLSTESVVEDLAGSKRTTETSLYLAKDLSLIKGEWQRTTDAVVIRLDFRRDGDGFAATRTITTTEGEKPSETLRLAAPPDVTYGRGAVLLFLKYAPAGLAIYDLPLASLESLLPAVDEHQVSPEAAPLRLEVKGPAKFGEKPKVVDSLLVDSRGDGRQTLLHLEPKTRQLIGIEYVRPPGLRVVPKGSAGPKVVYADDEPAKSWKAAFLKFGHGYHLAVPKWVDASFHWPTMFDHEVVAGNWAKELGIEAFKKAYIDEFMKKSKHRARPEADGLLSMTLATAEQKTLPDGTVVIATAPDFGGNVFHLKAIDGLWYIVRIDQ